MPDLVFEKRARRRGYRVVAGIDEAGRGPWAGPVYAAAAVLDIRRIEKDGLAALDDSKKLTPERRSELFERLHGAASVGIGWASVEEIDSLNILQATFLAMQRALAALPVAPDYCVVDGNLLPVLPCPAEAIVQGDGRCFSIAAASVLAKVARDRVMAQLAETCPGYGWERNKGYGTPEHRDAIDRLGVSAHHRRRWAPIFNKLSQLSLDLRDIDDVALP